MSNSVIENLPMEMRERFTDMREADLEVQNANDTLEDRTKVFFKKCLQSTVKKEWKDDQFGKIKEEYKKAVEQADEKVQLASQIYDMVDRHLRKLDVELNKFKMELEADNAGITEILEKRSLELDSVPKENNPPREKRKYTTHANIVETKKSTIRVPTTIKHETTPHTPIPETLDYSEPNSPNSASNSVSSLSYNLGNVGAQSNAALRAAATQAITATQHTMQQQGRRSTSLKASFEAATKKVEQSPVLSESLSSSSQSNSAADSLHMSRSQRVKKHTQKAEELIKAQQAKKQSTQTTSQSQPSAQQSPTAAAADVVEDGPQSADWAYDPNEPRYCLCNQVSYGEMVGCDNNDCTVEWFHYGCVGLTAAPKGKWYCPSCTAAMKRRGGRK